MDNEEWRGEKELIIDNKRDDLLYEYERIVELLVAFQFGSLALLVASPLTREREKREREREKKKRKKRGKNSSRRISFA